MPYRFLLLILLSGCSVPWIPEPKPREWKCGPWKPITIRPLSDTLADSLKRYQVPVPTVEIRRCQ